MDNDRVRLLSGGSTAALLSAGELTASALTGIYLAAIERFNPLLNCYLHVDADGALKDAAASDQRRRAGQSRGPLDGIPMAVKDNIAVAGWPTTAGLAGRANQVASADAAVIARLRAAGAVLLGSTNLDEAALGASTNNPHYGACHNPIRRGYTAGGSSGGSACAVRAGLAAWAVGSDTMGSVRIPAAYCGLVGLKPSFGAIDMQGVAPVWEPLDHLGVLVRHAGDLPAVLDAIANAPAAAQRTRRLGVLRLTGRVDLEPAVARAFGEALGRAAEAGYQLVELPDGDYDPVPVRRAGFLLAERALFDWLRSQNYALDELSAPLAKMLAYGARQSDAKLAEAQRRLDDTVAQASNWLADCDVLVMPTTPQRAFPLDTAAPVSQADFTVFASLAGWPAISLPTAHSVDDLPVGLQVVAPTGQDRALIQLAQALEPKAQLQLPPALKLA